MTAKRSTQATARKVTCSWPWKLPVASCFSDKLLAPKVPHLNLEGFSISCDFCNSFPRSSNTCKNTLFWSCDLRLEVYFQQLRRCAVNNLQTACVASILAQGYKLSCSWYPSAWLTPTSTNCNQQIVAVSWLQASEVHLLGVVYCNRQAFLQELQDPRFGLRVHDAHH